MSETSHTTGRKEIQLPAEFLQLANAIEDIPAEYRQSIDPILAQVMQSTRRRRRILSLVQDALGQLRLDMKYLMFDLEATRREREDFRQRLEEENI